MISAGGRVAFLFIRTQTIIKIVPDKIITNINADPAIAITGENFSVQIILLIKV